MNKILLFLGAFLMTFQGFSQKQSNNYQYTLDLTVVKDDRVMVELITPKTKQNEIEFHMPKIVPGTYSIYDFGRFVSDFKAFDKKGKELAVEKLDVNRWKISNAKKLVKITYWVDDTFDSKEENTVFEPGGTNIEEGKNFTINTFGFFGYLKDMKEFTFELDVKRPSEMYGATSLKLTGTKGNVDSYSIGNYFDFADMPIMYNKPDTTSLMVGGAEVLVSVYSPNKELTSKEVMDNVKELLLAQKEYLGGKLPVDKYTFLIYLNEGVGVSGSFGALEHSTSTLFFLIEGDIKRLGQTVRDVAAHEFFHIVTPLNIHSEEIGDYDFINPKMSKHLWMYEGGTEYAAQHVQVVYGLYSIEAFLADVASKMRGADQINTPVPFTEMSLGCLDKYKDYYGDVYQKGALINMCLDLRLRQLSDGKYGVQALMSDLSKKYGKTVSFKDAELFDEITKMTYPEIREFFRRYVEGNEPLPFKEYLAWVGIDYEEEGKDKQIGTVITQRSVGLKQDEGRLFVANAENLDEMGKAMGLQKNDVIIKYNGEDLTLQSVNAVIGGYVQSAKEGDNFEMVVRRDDKEVALSGKVMAIERTVKHGLKVAEKPTEKQLALRKAWINQ